MAASFQNWADAWGNSWGSVVTDPNAMYGSASFTISSALQVAQGQMQGAAAFAITATGELSHTSTAGRSGVSRLWLIEYYTKAFAAKEAALKPARTVKAKAAARKRAAERGAEVESLVAKAEADLEVLTQGIKDAHAAQQFTYNLLKQAQSLPDMALEIDFLTIANGYRERMRREDDDLLLLSMVL